jgi:hypothetical protein
MAAMLLLPGDQARREVLSQRLAGLRCIQVRRARYFAERASFSSLSMTAFTSSVSHSMAVFTE